MMGLISLKMEKTRKCSTWHWCQAHQIMFPGGRYRRYHLVASWSSGSEHLCGSGSLNELPRAQNLKQPVRNSSPIGIHDFTHCFVWFPASVAMVVPTTRLAGSGPPSPVVMWVVAPYAHWVGASRSCVYQKVATGSCATVPITSGSVWPRCRSFDCKNTNCSSRGLGAND
jgi:hypothetical protein